MIRAGLIALTLSLSHGVQGATIYNNGSPDQVSGTNMSEFLVAENFTLGAAADITNIRFWSIQSSATEYTGSVYWAVYNNVSNQPGSILQGNSTASVAGTATGNSTGFGYAEYSFDIPVVFQLAAGNYWLALHNGPLATTAPSEMLWATTAVSIGSNGKYLDGAWIDTGNEHAFRLDGTPVSSGQIPEPTTFALLAGGLAATAFLRRKS
ncbi:MAG: PEP-CTERM sorting domain-containing protein [Bryobacteraceae bacterium]